MTNNNVGGVDEVAYLIKIYEINQKILELLEKLNTTLVGSNPELDEEKKNNIEKVKTLSTKEKQIVFLILDGKLNKQIASELCLSMSTIEYHRSNIMRKLECNNVCQMIKMYLQWEGSL